MFRFFFFYRKAEWQHWHSLLQGTSVPHPIPPLTLYWLASERDAVKRVVLLYREIQQRGPKTQRPLPLLMSTLTLIGAPEGHSGLQTGVYPTEVAKEWLHLLAGWLSLLWDPGMDTARHQEVLPGIWSARQATSSKDIRTRSRRQWRQVQRMVKGVRREENGQQGTTV